MARGRSPGTRGPHRMRLAVATLTLVLAACGGLETPVAAVSGRIVGAGANGYAYPLGRPDLKVALDEGGAFRIEGVPTTARAMVLFDGAPSDARAELVEVHLLGGEEHRVPDRYGRDAPVAGPLKMAPAGSVVAGALPDGGGLPRGLAFTVLETDQERRPPDGTFAATLYPLPAGSFDVSGGAPGFRANSVRVQVVAGASVPVQLFLPVDADGAAPGCASSMGCKDGLHCNLSDGSCYACVVDGDCEDGERCDGVARLCTPISGASSEVCAACEHDSGCDAAAGLYCLDGSCAPLCAAGCPAGFTCGEGGRCKAPEGCGDWLRTMGAPCLTDEACSHDLAGGRCATPVAGSPGYCTAPCGVDADCRIGATTALYTCSGGLCTPPL